MFSKLENPEGHTTRLYKDIEETKTYKVLTSVKLENKTLLIFW